LLEGPVTGTDAIGGAAVPILGVTSLDWFGRSVSAAGDVDGDGTSDFVAGAPGVDDGGGDAGGAFLFLGPFDPMWFTIDDADLAMQGESPDDLAGGSVAGGGDLTGDDVLDLVVGAVGRTTSGADGGAVYVVSGDERGTLDLVFAEARVFGTDGGDWAGESVASPGDLDGDGGGRICSSGRPYADGDVDFAGAAYVFFGPITGSLDADDADVIRYGDSASDLAGFAVAGAADTDGDGVSRLPRRGAGERRTRERQRGCVPLRGQVESAAPRCRPPTRASRAARRATTPGARSSGARLRRRSVRRRRRGGRRSTTASSRTPVRSTRSSVRCPACTGFSMRTRSRGAPSATPGSAPASPC
jgi:hypothetical protein